MISLTFDFVKEILENEKYRLISTEYKNAKTKLEMICPKGHFILLNWDNFKQGKRCKECKKYRLRELCKNNTEKIIGLFENYGYKIVDGIETYENNKSRLTTLCPKGHTYETCFNNFSNGSRCIHCVDNKGANNGNWKGGLSPLNVFLRDKLTEWKK